ncbi:sensor histidine kinase [Ktedonobacteria bacterium brp13]|nr:sensor histidine kinase [Ktedonobacteria bacterium brp13]
MKHVQRFLSSGTSAKLAWKRYLSDSLLSIGGVALITSVALTELIAPQSPITLYIYQYPNRTIVFAYFVIVLTLASLRGLYAALLASFLALVAYYFFFIPPLYSLDFPPSDPSFRPLWGIFLMATFITSYLTSTQRKHAEQARSREQELRVLYGQARELATLQERHRIARELHDSVSQSLYGISLGAHTAQEALESEPEQAMVSIEYVIALAEAGLTEMRALIFELRPESLATEGLVAALAKQVAVLRTRYKLTVETELNEEPELPLEMKEALYRIAYEALYNVVKHAHASIVVIRFRQQADEISLEVRDNGKGFDPAGSFPGHLGLSSMRERATKIGGTFAVESSPGAGTSICVRIAQHSL